MNEMLGLGDTDADSRWIGVRRHQIVLVIVGIGLVGDWLFRVHGSLLEVIVGGALLACAAPFYDGLTLGAFLMVGLQFCSRSRWTTVAIDRQGESLILSARARAVVQGFELLHRGRLDLSGGDVQIAHGLASFADGLATSESSRHVSLHVRSSGGGARTLLSLPDAIVPPDGWLANNGLVFDVVGTAAGRPKWLLERWNYVRTPSGPVRVLRIRDFTAVSSGQAMLEKLQHATSEITVSLHLDVIAGSRARRVTERAVHRHRSDGATSLAAGFRRTALVNRSLERLGQREALVASGRSLLRVAVFATVRAPSRAELQPRVDEVLRAAHESGLRCERGVGRQSAWYCHQMPGGPGW